MQYFRQATTAIDDLRMALQCFHGPSGQHDLHIVCILL